MPRWLVWLYVPLFVLFATAGCGGALAKAEAPAPAMPAETQPLDAEGTVVQAESAEGTSVPPPPPAPMAASRSLDAATGPAGLPVPTTDRLAQAPKAPNPTPPKSVPDLPTPAAGGEGKSAKFLLIYQAELVMGVFETTKGIDQVENIARDAGGYLVTRNDQSITVRVPADKFQAALTTVMKVGDVLRRNVSVRDVTQEYYDLEIRLRNAEAMRQRLEQLLAKADRVEDALKVERELERVAGELERLKGQLKLLRELVSFSTITVRFQPTGTEHVENKFHLPFGWLEQLGLGQLLSL